MRTIQVCWTIGFLSTSLVAACGGGGQSGSTSCPNLAGTWSIVSMVDDTMCGGSVVTDTGLAVVTQEGCAITMTSDHVHITGSGSGHQLTGTSTSSDSTGIATGTFSGTLSADGNSVTGFDIWTYKSAATTCSGTTQIVATRLSSGGSGSTLAPASGGQAFGGNSATIGLASGGQAFGGNSATIGLASGGQAAGGVSGTIGLARGGSAGSNSSPGSGASAGTAGSVGLCSLVGFYPAAQAKHVIVGDSFAYVAEGSAGIEILDVSNPALPKAVGALPTTSATRLALNGSILYVADGSGGLKVVDVSAPVSPQLVATPTLPGSGPSTLQTLALSGTRLYAGYMNLDVFDVTNPASPVAKGALSTTFLQDMVVDGTLIYAATADGLEIFSALSPTPFLAGANKNNDWGQAIALSAGYAFYGSSNGLSVFDVSNPASPNLAASSGIVTSIKGFATNGNYLYVNGQGPGLSVLDISNPKLPKLVGKCGETSVRNPESMTISGQYGYVAGGTGGVVILKLLPNDQGNTGSGGAGGAGGASGAGGAGSAGASGEAGSAGHSDAGTSSSACKLVGFYPAVQANHVITSGTHAYVAEGPSGIEVLDISNPVQPTLVGALPTTGATRLAMSGNDLFVADGDGGLKVIDVSNPTSPQLTATPTLPGYGPARVQSLALGGTTLYAAYIGLNLFDVTNPAAPLAKGTLNGTFIQDMAVDGTLVYAATADGLDVFSALSPASPFLAGSYSSTDWGYAIAVSSGYVYYGSRNGLTVFDVSTPSTPTVAASSGALSSINGLTVHGNYLYVSGQGPGLSIVDISNPKLPMVVGKCGELSVGTPQSVTITGQYGYVAAGTGGVVILALTL